MPIKPNPLPPQPIPSNPTTGLVVSVNGTQYGVTPDPPPTPGQSWSTLTATLPPLHINADTPTQPALTVNGWITPLVTRMAIPRLPAKRWVRVRMTRSTAIQQTVLAFTAALAAAAPVGYWVRHTGAGVGVTGSSVSGTGIHASSGSGNAGLFDGNVQVNGTLTIRTVDVVQTVTQLTNRITALEQQIAALELQVAKLNTHYHDYGLSSFYQPDNQGYFSMVDVKNYILSALNSNLPGGSDIHGSQLDNQNVHLQSGTGKTVQSQEVTGPPLFGTPAP